MNRIFYDRKQLRGLGMLQMLIRLARRKFSFFLEPKESWKAPLKVTIGGANGSIGYAAMFRIASGEVFGRDQPLELTLFDLPEFEGKLTGSVMELEDCAFPLLKGVKKTADPAEGLREVDYAMLVCPWALKSQSRLENLKNSAGFFAAQAKVLGEVGKSTSKIVVVGETANSSCLALASNCREMARENFSALSRLGHNRALGMVARNQACEPVEVERFCVWGNHSPTSLPDISNVLISGKQVSFDNDWKNDRFAPALKNRDKTVFEARAVPCAASIASAALDHLRDWHTGTENRWTSMAVLSDGEYEIEKGIVFSYPVTVDAGKWKIVDGLKLTENSRQKLKNSEKELLDEKEAIKEFLN